MIPSLRETLAQLVYKVQAALAGNNCSSVFWAGNLKNKDLNGEEILSQVKEMNYSVIFISFFNASCVHWILLQTTSITRSSLSGDNASDYGMPSIGGSNNSKKASASQKAKPRKRKLRSIGEEEEGEDDDQGETSSKSSSRSRCF